MIWHLPHLHALAAAVGSAITLIAKPRSAAAQLLGADPAVRDIIWLDCNPEGRPGRHDGIAGLLRLAGELRARRFDAMVLLHHSVSLAAAARLAGIPQRAGYGYGAQRWLLNRGPVQSRRMLRRHQFQRASAWLEAAGIALAEAEPRLEIAESARGVALARLTGVPRPFVAIGIGASEPSRQWGVAGFIALVRGLRAMGWASMVLVGGRPRQRWRRNPAPRRRGRDHPGDRLAAGRSGGRARRSVVLRRQQHRGDEHGCRRRHPDLRTVRHDTGVRPQPTHRSDRLATRSRGRGRRMARITPQAVLAAIAAHAVA